MRTRRWRRAWLTSLLLHAAAGALLLAPGTGPEMLPAFPLPEPPLEVEIVEIPAPAAPAAPVSPAPAPSPTRPRPPTRPPAAETPVAEDPTGTLSFPERPRSLLPTHDQLGRAGIPAPEAAPAAPGRRQGPSRWQTGLGRLAAEDGARAAIAAGRAPPALFDVLRDARRFHAPSKEVLLALAKAHAARRRGTGRWLGRYLGGFLARERTAGADQPFDDMAAFKRGMAAAGIEFSARVCVEMDGKNPLPTAVLDRSSGIAPLDKLAVEVVTRAARRRALEIDRPARGCYRVTAYLTRVPPVPVLACGLNDDMRPECIYPLKELASTHVALDGAERLNPAAGSPDARPPDTGGSPP